MGLQPTFNRNLRIVTVRLYAFYIIARFANRYQFTRRNTSLPNRNNTINQHNRRTIIPFFRRIKGPTSAGHSRKRTNLRHFRRGRQHTFNTQTSRRHVRTTPPRTRIHLVTKRNSTILRANNISPFRRALTFQTITRRRNIRLQILLARQGRHIRGRIKTFFATRTPSMANSPTLTISTLQRRPINHQRTIKGRLRLLHPRANLATRHNSTFNSTSRPIRQNDTTRLRTRPNMRLLLTATQHRTILNGRRQRARRHHTSPTGR